MKNDKQKNELPQVSDELKAELDKVKADGLNIYALMAEVRKKAKSKTLYFPEAVLLKVCEQYWFYRTQIRRAFPWFVKVLYMEWCAYNARGYERISEQNKNKMDTRGGCAAIGDILTKMGIKNDV